MAADWQVPPVWRRVDWVEHALDHHGGHGDPAELGAAFEIPASEQDAQARLAGVDAADVLGGAPFPRALATRMCWANPRSRVVIARR